MPAQAIIAPLSVHSAGGGATKASRRRRRRARRAARAAAIGGDPAGRDERAPRIMRAKPGAAHSRCGRRGRRRSPASIAAARSAMVWRSPVPARQRSLADRGLEAGKREVAAGAAFKRPRQRETARVAVGRRRFDRRAAGIARPKQLGALVEGLAGRVVEVVPSCRYARRRRRRASCECPPETSSSR
jgi:hypothetical protein